MFAALGVFLRYRRRYYLVAQAEFEHRSMDGSTHEASTPTLLPTPLPLPDESEASTALVLVCALTLLLAAALTAVAYALLDAVLIAPWRAERVRVRRAAPAAAPDAATSAAAAATAAAAAAAVAANGSAAAAAPRAAPPPRVVFAAVRAATGGFSAARKIGEGATGEVFRGELDGAPVAVKVLRLPLQATAEARAQLERRFRAELEVLGRFVGHPRIVRLQSFAINDAAGGGGGGTNAGAGGGGNAAAGGGGGGVEAAQRPYALVFELLEEGSLADHLRAAGGAASLKAPLTALERVDAALGVAQGLAFLHGLREPGEAGAAPAGALAPVLHRDVKAANVGLTRHNGAYYAKLLDCGLAKAMRPPEAGAAGGRGGAAAASFTSGILGTPGYMAPEVANGIYTVRSEIYSLGVVLLELLAGRVAGAQTATELRDAAEDAEAGKKGDGAATAAANAEAGVWPPAAAAALAALALACVASRAAVRPADMKTVIAGLRGVRAALEGAAAAVPLAACGVCLEDVPAVAGALCKAAAPAARHFICHGCLEQHVNARLEPRLLAAAEGAMPCHAGAAACRAEPWALEDLTEHLNKATLVAYGRALRYQLYDAERARRLAEEAFAARERAANDARLALAERVRQHRLVIAERLLLLRCPRCATAFNDYSDCNALQCGQCGCGFCALCLVDCGRDAHAHYREAHGGDIFNRALFERTHRERRARTVAAAVRALAGEGAELQRALVAELAKADLRDLGIGVEDVLRDAAVGEGVEGDEALARRLQAEEDAAAAQGPPLPAVLAELGAAGVAPARIIALLRAHPGSLEVAVAGSRSLAVNSCSVVGRTMCIAAGAAPALVALAGEGVVKGSAGAAKQVARAMANLSYNSADGQARLLACGAAPAVVALAGEGVVKGSAGAAQLVARAMANLSDNSADGQARLLACGAAPALVALAGEGVIKGDAGAAESVALAMANLSANSDDGQAKLLACGAAPALVALAGEAVVKGSAGAAEWVAGAMVNLSISDDGQLLACGAAPALVALAGEDVVKGDAGAARYVAMAMASLEDW